MLRNAFTPAPIQLPSSAANLKIESVAVTNEGRKLWIGTSDG